MFVGFIAIIIILLIITAIMSKNNPFLINQMEMKIAYNKQNYISNIEQSIVNAVEDKCLSDISFCKSKDNSGVIELDISEISLPSSFQNTNLLGGAFSKVEIFDNFTTIRLYHDINNTLKRNLYLKSYQNRIYGIPPQCLSGTPPCDSQWVYHDFPSSLELRNGLR